MELAVNDIFIKELNQHLGIAHKISRIYFEDADDRQDALQEMMYQLWRSYPSFGGRSRFSTWMYQVCLNTALTYKKKNRSRGEALSRAHQQIPDDTTVSRNEEMDLLFQAISTLTPVNKAIVLLYLEDMSYEEIAAIAGISKSNVSVRLVRIKKELELKLKAKN